MDVDADALATWVAASFPGRGWSGERVRLGAFHHVCIGDQFVVRFVRGTHQSSRAAREARTLWALRDVHVGLPMPRLCSDVFSSPGRTAYLVTSVPGSQQPDLTWDEARAGHLQVLDGLRLVDATSLELPAARVWCGGSSLPQIVDEALSPRLPEPVARVARRLVDEVHALPSPSRVALVHGDVGSSSLLWHDGAPSGLIDFDRACVDDPAIDLAPLVDRYGVTALAGDFTDEALSRAMLHRATGPIQLAAAAALHELDEVRDEALRTLVWRHFAGTLYDRGGVCP